MDTRERSVRPFVRKIPEHIRFSLYSVSVVKLCSKSSCAFFGVRGFVAVY